MSALLICQSKVIRPAATRRLKSCALGVHRSFVDRDFGGEVYRQ